SLQSLLSVPSGRNRLGYRLLRQEAINMDDGNDADDQADSRVRRCWLVARPHLRSVMRRWKPIRHCVGRHSKWITVTSTTLTFVVLALSTYLIVGQAAIVYNELT
ncbi:hypothetical protein PENTCL1PPCAC_17614, partial [Pristionchus entomophagus]